MDIGLLETRRRLTQSALHGLEDMIEALFEHPVMIPGTGMAEIPVIGEPGYIVALDHSHFLPAICRAMVAKEKFRQQHPEWPDLPLRQKEIEAMKDGSCPRCNVVGYFADSLRGRELEPTAPRLR